MRYEPYRKALMSSMHDRTTEADTGPYPASQLDGSMGHMRTKTSGSVVPPTRNQLLKFNQFDSKEQMNSPRSIRTPGSQEDGNYEDELKDVVIDTTEQFLPQIF